MILKFVHICGKRYVDRVEENTKVTVYSNQPSVEPFADGKSLGIQESPDHFFYFHVPNEGETVLAAAAGECRDTSRIRKTEVFNEAYRLKEKGAVLNWFDINAPEGYFSLNDSLSDIVATEEGRKLLGSILENMGKQAGGSADFDMSSDAMVQIASGFSVIRLLNLMGAANIEVTKEQMLELNKALNKMKKVF